MLIDILHVLSARILSVFSLARAMCVSLDESWGLRMTAYEKRHEKKLARKRIKDA